MSPPASSKDSAIQLDPDTPQLTDSPERLEPGPYVGPIRKRNAVAARSTGTPAFSAPAKSRGTDITITLSQTGAAGSARLLTAHTALTLKEALQACQVLLTLIRHSHPEKDPNE